MFTRWTFFAVLILNLWVCLVARAAVIDFTIEGVVTESSRPDVSVGDPFTIRYSADSQDLDPSPTVGSYSATKAIVTFPGTTYTSSGFSPIVWVTLETADVVTYRDIAPNQLFWITLAFPAGTLISDELPCRFPYPMRYQPIL